MKINDLSKNISTMAGAATGAFAAVYGITGSAVDLFTEGWQMQNKAAESPDPAQKTYIML